MRDFIYNIKSKCIQKEIKSNRTLKKVNFTPTKMNIYMKQKLEIKFLYYHYLKEKWNKLTSKIYKNNSNNLDLIKIL